MDYQHISMEREEEFAVVTMRRAGQRNALSEDHLAELLDAFRKIGAGEARGVILAAEGPVFCAGHDFDDMSGRDLTQMKRLLAVCADVMQTIQSIGQRVRGFAARFVSESHMRVVPPCEQGSRTRAEPDQNCLFGRVQENGCPDEAMHRCLS